MIRHICITTNDERALAARNGRFEKLLRATLQQSMAIEFNCPYCTSTIRVADNAAGKKGTCPRCETAILVPSIELPTQTAARAEHPATAPATDPPTEVSPPPAEWGDFPQFSPTPLTTELREPSYAGALRRRRKKSRWGLVIPLLGGLALISIVIYFFVQNRPWLDGELTAVAIDDIELPPGGVGRNDISGLPKEVVDYVLDELRENPVRLISSLVGTEFRGTRRGLEVRVFEGNQTRFFRVAVGKNEHFADWVKDHANELEKPHFKEYQSVAKRFFVEYEAAQGDLPNLTDYRDSLGLNVVVGRVGYNMAAIVSEKIYRCVYEDGEGRLFFLLPRKTKKFELVGRKLKNGQIIFPGHYNVQVK